jgi:hypothetical protein
LKSFEDIVTKQLKIASDFQKELESTRAELMAKTTIVTELEVSAS